MLAVAATVFGVPMRGSAAALLAGGLLLATATASMAQFGLLAMPVLVVMNLLSGGSTPHESMPVWLRHLVQISPATQFVAFSQAVLYRGAGLEVVAPRLAALALLGGLFLAAALAGLRRSLARIG